MQRLGRLLIGFKNASAALQRLQLDNLHDLDSEQLSHWGVDPNRQHGSFTFPPHGDVAAEWHYSVSGRRW